MVSITMGFALLLVRLDYQGGELILGITITILLLLCAGMLRFRFGWVLGWCLQAAVLLYGFVIPSMFFMGAIFAALWIAAIHFGKKGEAIRAALIAERDSGEK